MKMKYVTRERLVELYWQKQLNQRQIAALFCVNDETVSKRMKKFSIPIRNRQETLILQYKDPKRKRNTWSKGRKASDETRLKNSLSHKGQKPWNTGRHWSEEQRKKMALAQKGRVSPNKGLIKSEEQKEKDRRVKREYWDNITPENIMKREQIRKRVRANWQDPNFVLKQIQARGANPNKPERKLDNILIREFSQFRYNGDGRLGIVLAGLVPDFVNVNGRKEVIEVFGIYWHQLKEPKWHQTELGRIMAYKSIGWECLVIWENELKNTEAVIKKIKEFTSTRKVGT